MISGLPLRITLAHALLHILPSAPNRAMIAS
jgi:hypothetical protein